MYKKDYFLSIFWSLHINNAYIHHGCLLVCAQVVEESVKFLSDLVTAAPWPFRWLTVKPKCACSFLGPCCL